MVISLTLFPNLLLFLSLPWSSLDLPVVSPSLVTSLLQSSPPSPCLCLRYDDIQPNFPSKVISSSQKHFDSTLLRLSLGLSTLTSSPLTHTLCPTTSIYPDIRGQVCNPKLDLGHGTSAIRSQVKLWPQHRTPVGTEGKTLRI